MASAHEDAPLSSLVAASEQPGTPHPLLSEPAAAAAAEPSPPPAAEEPDVVETPKPAAATTTPVPTTTVSTATPTTTVSTATVAVVAVPFREIDLGALEFSALTKEQIGDRSIYVSRISYRGGTSVLIQTPPVTLETSVDRNVDRPYATFAPRGSLAKFMRDTEAALLEAAIRHKDAWLGGQIAEDALRASFKTFFVDGKYRARVCEDVAVFDAGKQDIDPADLVVPGPVRAVLALDRLAFGKTEFGGVWRIVQIQAVPSRPCLISDASTGPTDIHDFL